MTALSEYQRLECTGLWREHAAAQRREVIVTFGDATLMLKEAASDRALAHWSLPALTRANPGEMPAIFRPDPDAEEELEIDDEVMIAAIGKVHRLIEARRPHPGRLRGALVASLLAAFLGAMIFWLPGALIAHTAKVLPAPVRAAVGQAILADVTRLSGPPCAEPEGLAAADLLSNRLLGRPGALVILPEGLQGALHLPGGLILAGRPLLDSGDDPALLAGHILAEELRARRSDALTEALSYAGFRATFHLLTTGEVPSEAFHGYGERLLKAPVEPVSADDLTAQATRLHLDPAPYLTATGATSAPAGGDAVEPVITDTDWVGLQGICG
ncbi:hypothetical protein OU426_04730 [Frigidibacter sp. RF13]|uniref:hypothetical protein n=1 Tax=Frigidibacter sp. RF13 TaxID=2997340 RepID=UPI00226E2650|nr:hypothetical protein [Frigidibacter sp. RF13]MCY1126151.1 hypothetical protein [Frigidibacter sp. RF13]